MSGSGDEASKAAEKEKYENTLVQYICVRGDLQKSMNWPTGSVIAQAAHAAVGIIFETAEDPAVRDYCSGGVGDSVARNMHKVVVEAKDEKDLTKLALSLSEEKVLHKVWIEQPENIPTCLATKPYPRKDIARFFKKFRLYK
eukprot:tig00021312_g20071.t1